LDIHVLTVFPQLYRPFRTHGLVKQGLKKNKFKLSTWSLRRFTEDDYGDIDARAYGGNYGMVMKPGPYFRGVEHIHESRGPGKTLLMAPDGRQFDNEAAKDLSNRDRIIILSGRYEGIDQRVRDELCDEVWSIGPYVTPGGDLPALVMISSIVRHIPGVVGNRTSVSQDSFQRNRLAPPHYTRPREFRDLTVPDVLLSGDHGRIEEWRKQKAEERTRENRPNLIDDETTGNDN
jgi:tRNA (guanine37-N1)-methyltransferase